MNIYALIHSNIVRAALFNVILEEGHVIGLGGCEGHCQLIINHYTGRDWLPGVWQTAVPCKWYLTGRPGTDRPLISVLSDITHVCSLTDVCEINSA